jgi:hypothetical protein
MKMKFFEDSNALDSLRHSDFDSLSAYGEVIDNSLQAEAKRISIQMFKAPPKNGYEQIEYLAFADDGIGMPKDVLHACLKLGWSSRYNDRTGIGRFGVGMVLGAIHEVKKIEVYSKEKGGQWRYTYIDLDEIEAKKLDEIPEPVTAEIPKKFLHLISDDRGTLVLWSKYDKQKKSAPLLAKDATHWIGRTFRYFIWDGVQITLDGQEVKAHDPLYTRTEKTNFPSDPKGKQFESVKFHWNVPSDDKHPKASESSEIEIKMSILPEEFRKRQGAGGSAAATQRFIDENEGISILRNRREVFYGILPHWSSVRSGDSKSKTWSFEEKDRFWGCEVLFNAELDSEFSVKNIKRGAEPSPALKALIKKQITPTRKTVLDEVDRVWKDSIDAEKAAANPAGTLHAGAEKVATKTVVPGSRFNSSISAMDAAKEIVEKVLHDKSADEKASAVALFQSQPFTIKDSRWGGLTFWEIHHAGGNALISYNKNHEFFSQYYSLVEALETGTLEPTTIANQLRVLIDLLLISAAKSQALNDENADVGTVGDFIDQFNNEWGMMLANYVKSWRKEQD